MNEMLKVRCEKYLARAMKLFTQPSRQLLHVRCRIRIHND